MNVKLLAEHHLEFLSFKGGCTGSYESTLVKMPYCWKSHVAAQLLRLLSENVISYLLHVYCTNEKKDAFYCKFGNFRENFIIANSVKTSGRGKTHICDVKNSRQGVIYLYQ